MAVCPVMAATGREFECNTVLCCQQCILDRDKSRVGEHIHVPAAAGSMVGAGSDRLDRSFPVDHHDVCPGFFGLPGEAGDLFWRPVTWKGGDDLGYADGTCVILRFKMRNATLYGLEFS